MDNIHICIHTLYKTQYPVIILCDINMVVMDLFTEQQCLYVHHPSPHSVTIAITEQCQLVQHSYMYKYIISCDINHGLVYKTTMFICPSSIPSFRNHSNNRTMSVSSIFIYVYNIYNILLSSHAT